TLVRLQTFDVLIRTRITADHVIRRFDLARHRPQGRAPMTTRDVHEQAVLHAQQISLYVFEVLQLVELRESAKTDVLSEISGVGPISRQAIGGAEQRIEVRFDQVIEAVLRSLSHFNSCHLNFRWPYR